VTLLGDSVATSLRCGGIFHDHY